MRLVVGVDKSESLDRNVVKVSELCQSCYDGFFLTGLMRDWKVEALFNCFVDAGYSV